MAFCDSFFLAVFFYEECVLLFLLRLCLLCVCLDLFVFFVIIRLLFVAFCFAMI